MAEAGMQSGPYAARFNDRGRFPTAGALDAINPIDRCILPSTAKCLRNWFVRK